MYGVVLVASDSASIGGTVATSAGGLRVIAHGMTRAQPIGIFYKPDVSVPLASLAQCADELRSVVDAFSDVTVCGVFGHLADGSIHVEIAAMGAIKRALDPVGLMNPGVLLEG